MLRYLIKIGDFFNHVDIIFLIVLIELGLQNDEKVFSLLSL